MTKRNIFNSKGSSTLELTIIFPVILSLLMAVIFFVIFVYHKLAFLDTAIYTAKETAAMWSNSGKDLETGSIIGNNNDGLYWRIYDDHAGSLLVQKKVKKADTFAYKALLESMLGDKETGSIITSYNRGLVKRSVSTKIQSATLSAAATADVSEPAEFIRVFLLGKEYTAELLKYLDKFGKGAVPAVKGPFIASRKSDVYGQRIYHYPGCKYISKIKRENVIEFQSEEEAAKGGFSLCIICAKSLLSGQGK